MGYHAFKQRNSESAKIPSQGGGGGAFATASARFDVSKMVRSPAGQLQEQRARIEGWSASSHTSKSWHGG